MSLFSKRVSVLPAILTGVILSSFAFGEDSGLLSPFGLGLTVGVKHTDNRDTIPDNYVVKGETIDKENDTEFWVTPRLSYMKKLADRYSLYLEYSPSYIYSANPRSGGTESEWAHAARANLEFNISPRTLFTFTDRYWWSGSKNWYYGDDYVLADRERAFRNDDYYENTMTAAIKHDLTADDFVRLTGKWRIKRYDSDTVADYGDEDEYSALAEWMHRATRHFAYGLFTEYTAFDRKKFGEDADPFSTDGTERIDVGVQYVTMGVQAEYDIQGNRNFVLTGRTGYNFMWYEAEQLDDQNTIGDSKIELSIYQLERTSGRIGFRYGKQFADVYPYSSQDNTAVYGGISRGFGRQGGLRLGADVEFRNRSYSMDDLDPDADAYAYYREKYGDKDDLKRDSIWVRLSATYKWSEDFSTMLFYTFEDVNSDVDASYTENVVGLQAMYEFL